MVKIKTDKIKNIKLDSSETWQDNIFITLDLDWAIDEVIKYSVDIIEKYNCKATFFATHSSTLIDKLSLNKNFELGIHPNFNFLLEGDFRYGSNYSEVIRHWLDQFPSALSVRSHSMTQNSKILSEFSKEGLQFDCNHFLPRESNIKDISPFLFWDKKLIRVPYFWEDDVNMLYYNHKYNIDELLQSKGLRVFDFHPIHIFLNTYSLDHYQSARPYYKKIDKLAEIVNNEKYGVRDFFIELLSRFNK